MDLMIDLETLGTGPNSVIVEIGAIFFHRESGFPIDNFHKKIDARSCWELGMETDSSTIDWWKKQGKSIEEFSHDSRDSITLVIMQFWYWVKNNLQEDTLIWCKGMDFDLAILRNAFDKCGYQLPWHYSKGRDVRTIIKLAPHLEPVNNGQPHDAQDDCMYQINFLVAVLRHLKVKYGYDG